MLYGLQGHRAVRVDLGCQHWNCHGPSDKMKERVDGVNSLNETSRLCPSWETEKTRSGVSFDHNNCSMFNDTRKLTQSLTAAACRWRTRCLCRTGTPVRSSNRQQRPRARTVGDGSPSPDAMWSQRDSRILENFDITHKQGLACRKSWVWLFYWVFFSWNIQLFWNWYHRYWCHNRHRSKYPEIHRCHLQRWIP